MKSLFKGGMIFFLYFLFLQPLSAQTVFWTETFDGSVCAAGSGCDPSIVAWNVASLGGEGANANRFYVSCQENGNAAGTCGSGCGTDQTLHLGNVSTSSAAFLFCPDGDCGAAYDASGAGEITNKRAESPVISSAGYSGISITYLYIERGQNTLDNATLWYYDGSSWIQVEDTPKTNNTGCLGQGRWTSRTVALPAGANNNPNLKIGFRWVNNGDGTGSDPSFAVDDIQLTYTTVLPIELISFTGNGNEKGVQLKWTTASEINNDYFTLEKSIDGENFEPFLVKAGAGNSQELLFYEALDTSPYPEISYYRLKQTDFNGDFNYSSVIAVRTGTEFVNQWMMFPNPSSQKITVMSRNEISYIRIYDLNGNSVYHQELQGVFSVLTDISSLKPGVYIVETDPLQIPQQKKLIIQTN